MKQQILWALLAAFALPTISNAQIIDTNTAFTIRVGVIPSFLDQVVDGSAHSFTANFTSGQGSQTIGNIFDAASGETVLVNANDTFVVDGAGNFTYTLTVESAGRGTQPGDVGFGDLSISPASGTGTGLLIGQNLTNAFVADPDFGGATPPNPFTPTNAVPLPHVAETATITIFDLDDGSLRGSDEVLAVAAFQNGTSEPAWEGFLGVFVGVDADDIPDGTVPTGRIGAVTMTITGTVPATLLLGDVDTNGSVNFLDIAPFIALLSNGGVQDEADIDQNGIVNFLDIAPFIQLLSSN